MKSKLLMLLVGFYTLSAQAFVGSEGTVTQLNTPQPTRAGVCMFNSSHRGLTLQEAHAKCLSDESSDPVIKARSGVADQPATYSNLNECLFYLGLDHDDMFKVLKLCQKIMGKVAYHPRPAVDSTEHPVKVLYETHGTGQGADVAQ